MKKGFMFLGVVATAISTIAATPASWFILHNPELPKSMKK